MWLALIPGSLLAIFGADFRLWGSDPLTSCMEYCVCVMRGSVRGDGAPAGGAGGPVDDGLSVDGGTELGADRGGVEVARLLWTIEGVRCVVDRHSGRPRWYRETLDARRCDITRRQRCRGLRRRRTSPVPQGLCCNICRVAQNTFRLLSSLKHLNQFAWFLLTENV